MIAWRTEWNLVVTEDDAATVKSRYCLGVMIRTGPKRPDFISGGILS